MTAHSREWAELRVGCTVTLRDWRGDIVTGEAFLSPSGVWLMRMRSGAVFPVVPRELIAVANGASEMRKRLVPGARIEFVNWEGRRVIGIVRHNPGGVWEVKDPDGARWLLEPHTIVSITPQEGA